MDEGSISATTLQIGVDVLLPVAMEAKGGLISVDLWRCGLKLELHRVEFLNGDNVLLPLPVASGASPR